MTETLLQAVSKERRIKLIAFLAALLLMFLVIIFIKNMLVSFLIAFVNYYLLSPAVDYLERSGNSRLKATLIPFVILSSLIIGGLILFSPVLAEQLKGLQNNIPAYTEAVSQFLSDLEIKIGTLVKNFYPVDLKGQIQPIIAQQSSVFFKMLPELASQSFAVILLVPFFSFFMLLDGREFMRRFISLVPNNLFELTLNLNHQISTQLGGFIRARLIESIVVGLIIWIGLLSLNFPFALLLAVFAGILNIVPYIGPLIGALPAVVICFANRGGNSELFWILTTYGIAQVVDTVILVPFLVAKIVNLHPVTVVLAVFIGAETMGIIGMIICIPLMAVFKVSSIAIYRHVTDFRD